ncbi:hypothetical protein F53441_8080 [Fusarium austroafricanum]|uniref:F-box domain-containing protein n=1 Tax=Fusarium austroafricanum TaxID=2364996 RepID=A0A8H4KG47_9HYPO|nr:hypothetical protein F53441_8080 [Fusarium austroafricanum]
MADGNRIHLEGGFSRRIFSSFPEPEWLVLRPDIASTQMEAVLAEPEIIVAGLVREASEAQNLKRLAFAYPLKYLLPRISGSRTDHEAIERFVQRLIRYMAGKLSNVEQIVFIDDDWRIWNGDAVLFYYMPEIGITSGRLFALVNGLPMGQLNMPCSTAMTGSDTATMTATDIDWATCLLIFSPPSSYFFSFSLYLSTSNASYHNPLTSTLSTTVLAMSETSSPLDKLPLEILENIGTCLMASELDGAASASKAMRRIFSRSMFHNIHFAGLQADLARKLVQFLSVQNLKTVQMLIPSMKNIRIRVYGRNAPFAIQKILLLSIGAVLGALKDIQGVRLYLFAPQQEAAFHALLSTLPNWERLKYIEFDEDCDIGRYRIFANKANSINAVRVSGYDDIKAVRDAFPNLERLAIPFEFPGLETSESGEGSGLNNSNFIPFLNTSFPKLEWLCLDDTWIDYDYDDQFATIRGNYEVLVTRLVEDLAQMRNLRRFGARFPLEILESYDPEDPFTSITRQEVEAFVDPIVAYMGKKLRQLQQISFFDEYWRVYRGIRMPDGTIKLNLESNSDNHAFPCAVMY